MLRIQLAHSYFLRFDQKQWERGKPYPPLATIQVAAMLRRMGHEVTLFDAMLAEGVDAYADTLRDARPDLVVLYEDNFNFLTKMCLGRMHEAACRMVSEASGSGARVLVAGSDASDRPGLLLEAGADAVLIGEGIAALCELVGRLDREQDIDVPRWMSGIGGVASPHADTVATRPPNGMPPAPQLSGEAAWDLVDIERYRRLWEERHGYFSMNMVASRGCPFRCNWCAKPIWGNHYRQRSARDVAEEMAMLKRRFRPDHIWMADDIFGFRVDWLDEFAERLGELDGMVPFSIQIRANMISEAMAAALERAGCVEAWIGAESGSQRILDAMAKDTDVEHVYSARSRLGAHGIRVGFFIQLGYLGEQLEDLLATRELVANAAPDEIGVSVSYPLPGTRFYEQVKAQLGAKTHWDDSGDLAMMFRGAYDSGFYRSFRDLLHRQVELMQSEQGLGPRVYGEACARLEARWQALLASGRDHLRELGHVAAAEDC
ncbi:radical SAM protein [Luteimonas sp. 8-5]|uniref:B12-binding domain-containing radical SAM protein n=1 Tax=Luteimonas sp. 8-5 TaxID=3039387 RepID=UPI002436E746|nr:radical SAM protein [Luteimonas sp. 8-5]MDG6349233.1 radical SAM protein [Luteimonas sp. 8-5]